MLEGTKDGHGGIKLQTIYLAITDLSSAKEVVAKVRTFFFFFQLFSSLSKVC